MEAEKGRIEQIDQGNSRLFGSKGGLMLDKDV